MTPNTLSPDQVYFPQPVASLHFFDTREDAIAYRALTGAAGLIFASFDKGEATLFPDNQTARDVLSHPLIRGVQGWLIERSGKEVSACPGQA